MSAINNNNNNNNNIINNGSIPTKESYLHVLSSDGKSWKKRFCSIRSRILYIYPSRSKSIETSSNYQILHFIPLAKCAAIETVVKGGPLNRANCFKISHNSDQSFQYWLSAEAVNDMEDWIKILTQLAAIQKSESVKLEPRVRSKSVCFKPGISELLGLAIDHQGWLKKLSTTGTFRKSVQWKKQWFVLKDLVLYFYDNNQDSQQLKGKMSIPNWSVQSEDEMGVEGFCFTLSHKGYPTVTLQAETEQEREKWIQSIKQQNRSLTTTTPTDADMTQLKNWLSTLIQLEIKDPMELLHNPNFVVNILLKNGCIMSLEQPNNTQQQDLQWNLKAFEKILYHVKFQGIKFDPLITAQDFVDSNPIILNFIISIMNHFHKPTQSTPSSPINNSTPSSTPLSPPIQSQSPTKLTEQVVEIVVNESVSTNNTTTTTSSTEITSATTTTTTTTPIIITEATVEKAEEKVVNDNENNENKTPTNELEESLNNIGSGGRGGNTEIFLKSLSEEISNLSTTQSTHVTPVHTPTKISPRFYSPAYKSLKRVETKEVLGEFDKIFLSIGKSNKCGHCNENIIDKSQSIEAVGKIFHLNHFQCCICNKQLLGDDQLSINYIERDLKIYCKEDHDKTYQDSQCSQCQKSLMITFAHRGKLLCRDHYLNLVGDTLCQSCQQTIQVDEAYQQIDSKKWHSNHFTCSYCKDLLNPQTCKVKNSSPYCKRCFTTLF
ncbi:prespore-specific protein [Tieghemostelium lacteum]|uniref:Prespore-specific protein n=1 Tax=Tieghemostelium lacteum TaxID=361077 RepID=A0A151Z2J2_TIELA|nr:prespore-specific protein [Tieghemostelium lacteum]|eukprot:KYQ88181.1 prespore-specific protein [Tieghemostelium lacteum]